MHWDQNTKGMIFFFWAAVQNLTPVFTGGFADKYGRKKILFIAVLIAALGFILMGLFKTVLPLALSTLILGFGLGLFKPTIQGMIANSMNSRNESIGWGIVVMMINLAVFAAPPVTKYFESISWTWVFVGSGLIILTNLILLLFVKDETTPNPSFIRMENQTQNETNANEHIFKRTIKELTNHKVLYFILIMSGFMTIYMQFYETLPNFIYDWVDTASLAKSLRLPGYMMMDSPRGLMIDFKWLYNINSGFVVIGVVFVSWWFSRFSKSKGLIIGITVATIGLVISGATYLGGVTAFGMLFYTFGEMLTNPKFSEYMSSMAGSKDKSLFMGFMSFSMAVGLAGGSLLGGFSYKHLGEKSGFALKYLNEHFGMLNNISHQYAMDILIKKTGMTNSQITTLLWNQYQPELVWLPFLALGLISAFLLWIYSKKM